MQRVISGLFLVLTGTVFMGCQSTIAASTAYPDGAAGTITIDGSNPKSVSTLYGQNYWCWDGYGDNMPNAQALVGGLKLDVLRAGGYNNDAEKSTGAYGSDPFGDSQIDAFIGYCKSVGAAPVLQVPLIENYKANNGTANPVDAAAIVRYCSAGCFTPMGIYCKNGHLIAEVLSLDGKRTERIEKNIGTLEDARAEGTAFRSVAGDLIAEAYHTLGISYER